MKTVKVSLISTIFVAAFGLAFWLMGAPALAGPPDADGCHPDHKAEECPVSGDGDVTLYEVTLATLVAPGTGTSADVCLGTTDRQANPGLSVHFEEGCFVELTVDSEPVGLNLFGLEGKTKGSGVTEIRLYFTTISDFGEKCLPCPNDTIWVTDSLLASTDPDPVGAEDFVLFVLPMEPPHTLIKIHKPERGAETTDGVLIGEFTYKVIP